jgi:hypothetical protein
MALSYRAARRLSAHAGSSLFVLLAACSSGGDGAVVTDPPVASGPDGGAVSAGDGGTLDTRQPPSRNFDLSQWKLTLPSGEEVKTVELNSGYSMADVFYTDPDTGGMVFRCPNIGGTTPNSKFSRTELREMLAPDGPAYADENNWTTTSGGTLRATLRVDHVSTTGDDYKVGRVIIGQIHGEGAEVIRLYYHKRPDEAKGRIYGGLDSADNVNGWSPDIIPNSNGGGIALGEVFSYEISLHGLQLSVRIEPAAGDAVTYYKDIDPGYEGTNLYFKAGVYNQNNTGDVSDYAQATFLALTQEH